ncbi:EF-hand domain-containing protein [Lysobacter sp. Root916]|nr:EF-hand domain-containing protein [Lysobacter sp. Root916]
MFEQMDADHDGKVSAAEMDAAHRAMSQQQPPKANADDPPQN